MFAVQTVVCGDFSGDMLKSNVVSVNLSNYYGDGSSEIYTTSVSSQFSDADVRFYAALSSASFFAMLFVISTVIITLMSFTMLYLKRRVKIQAALELPTVTNIQASAEDIIATENIAYDL